VLVGHRLPLNFPRLAVSPTACAPRCSVQAGWRCRTGLLPEQPSLAQATPARRKNRANRASGVGRFVIQDSSQQVTGPSRAKSISTGHQGIRPILANKLRHAPATGLLTSGFTINGTDTSVPNPPSCLAIGDNRPENRCQRSRGTACQRGFHASHGEAQDSAGPVQKPRLPRWSGRNDEPRMRNAASPAGWR